MYDYNIKTRLDLILSDLESTEFLYERGELCEEATKEHLFYLNKRLDFIENRFNKGTIKCK